MKVWVSGARGHLPCLEHDATHPFHAYGSALAPDKVEANLEVELRPGRDALVSYFELLA